MNEELENQLAKVIEKALQVAEATGEFAIDQAHELLQEFYRWHIISNLLGVIVSAGIIYLVFQIRKLISTKKEDRYKNEKVGDRYYETDGGLFLSYCIVGGCVVAIFAIAFIIDLQDLIQIIVAPKIYLIEYFIESTK